MHVFRTREPPYVGGRFQPGPGRSFAYWLFTIARNLLRDFCRPRNLYIPAEIDPQGQNIESREPAPPVSFQAEEEDEWLEQALELLPEHQGLAMRLRLDGCSYAQIAAVMNIAEGTVGSHLNRATATLHQRAR
jgi:RNA polymerase sigma-70 factor (ECF subfamily)